MFNTARATPINIAFPSAEAPEIVVPNTGQVRQLKDAILTSESTFLIGEGVLKDTEEGQKITKI
jgi:hypothetical protein